MIQRIYTSIEGLFAVTSIAKIELSMQFCLLKEFTKNLLDKGAKIIICTLKKITSNSSFPADLEKLLQKIHIIMEPEEPIFDSATEMTIFTTASSNINDLKNTAETGRELEEFMKKLKSPDFVKSVVEKLKNS